MFKSTNIFWYVCDFDEEYFQIVIEFQSSFIQSTNKS